MFKLKLAAGFVGVLSLLLGFQRQQASAACQCVCFGTTGVPSSVDVPDVTGNCDDEFSYTFKVHFATNDECGSASGNGNAAVFSDGAGSCNVADHSISPATFTVADPGHTQLFTVEGETDIDASDGISKVTWVVNSFDCIGDVTVPVNRDSDDCGPEDPECN